MARHTLRFGVSDGQGSCGTTWKLETRDGKSDIYLACRPLQGQLKASLHESGQWRIAYLKHAFEKSLKGVEPTPKRVIDEWPRPAALESGATVAFRIVTPYSSMTSKVHAGRHKNVQWIQCAPEGKATEIAIVITPPRPTKGWPGQRAMNSALVGSVPVHSGETVWAVYYEIGMPDLSGLSNIGRGHYYAGKSAKDLVPGTMLRMLAFRTVSDGSRAMYDLPIRVKAKGSETS